MPNRLGPYLMIPWRDYPDESPLGNRTKPFHVRLTGDEHLCTTVEHT